MTIHSNIKQITYIFIYIYIYKLIFFFFGKYNKLIPMMVEKLIGVCGAQSK